MPFAGTYDAVLPGELKTFAIDFVLDLIPGDTILSTTAVFEVFFGVDPQAAQLLFSPVVMVGTSAVQMIGGAEPNGFQPGVVYRWTVTLTTAGGTTIIAYAHLPCAAIE